jgi:hypothetical protein
MTSHFLKYAVMCVSLQTRVEELEIVEAVFA